MVRIFLVAVSFFAFSGINAFANYPGADLNGLVFKSQKLLREVYHAPIRGDIRALVDRFNTDVNQLSVCTRQCIGPMPYPTPYGVNPPGPVGGPGVGYGYGANPPGPAGGPGAGYGYNPPGPVGGPGAGYGCGAGCFVPPQCRSILELAKRDFVPVDQSLVGTAYALPQVYAALVETRQALYSLR